MSKEPLLYLEQDVRTKMFTITKEGLTGPEEKFITYFGHSDFSKMMKFRNYMNEHHMQTETLSTGAVEIMYRTFSATPEPFSFE